jgi:hypothetical protein
MALIVLKLITTKFGVHRQDKHRARLLPTLINKISETALTITCQQIVKWKKTGPAD